MISGPTEPRENLSSSQHEGNEEENRTEWYFKLGRELNRLVDLNHAIRRHIVQEPPKVEDENWWKFLDENLLTRFAGTRWTTLNRLRMRDACKCVFYSVHRIMLSENINVSHHII
jgi:hypothetical protein